MSLYRIYLDESGDHSYHLTDMPNKRYLGLTGCVIEKAHYQDKFQPQMEQLKRKHFEHDPDDPVILHRDDIINCRRSFWRLRDPANKVRFDTDLLDFLSNQDYTIISVVIDKKAHEERYESAAFHPYHYCLAVIMERSCGFLHFKSARGDILAESRGGKENQRLCNAYNHIYIHGTMHRKAEFFREVLTSKELKIKPKSANVAGLQLADLLAHPCKQNILQRDNRIAKHDEKFGAKICETIEAKYNRQIYQNKIEGYGRIFIK